MLERATERLAGRFDASIELHHTDFRTVRILLQKLGLRADGLLLDLGLNSAQVDDPDRGLSFLKPGPLDMRMDRSRGEPASSILNRMALGEIEAMLWEYGDERWARMIARKVIERRKRQPLRTTEDLVECVLAAIPVGARDKRIHPATRTFQAVRVYVNGELEELDTALTDAAASLAPGGVLAVLSYHSGEDRIVKNTFKGLAQQGYEDVFKKPVVPTEGEIRQNSRARSAKLRALRAPR
jgi:16S rRNA (cytosine1402-N4)-methyltransferase